MSVLFYSETDDPQPWRQAFAVALADMPFEVWPDVTDIQSIRYALVWNTPSGLLFFQDSRASVSTNRLVLTSRVGSSNTW